MGASASVDLLRLLAGLAATPTPAHADYAAALDLAAPADLAAWHIAHTAAFVEQCPPYASAIVGEGGMIGGEAADRVADFRRLLGASADVAPDALGALLADYAELCAQSDSDARAAHARAALLWEHLLPWVMPYLDGVVRSAPPPYDGWAMMVGDVLRVEASVIEAPAHLPLHLRAAPEPADPAAAATANDAVRALLVPIASGLVITRADLARAVEKLGVGLVQNSRAFMLEHLLAQEGAATLAWLADEARCQAEARDAERSELGQIASFWAGRAAATAQALDDLARQAGHRHTAGEQAQERQSA